MALSEMQDAWVVTDTSLAIDPINWMLGKYTTSPNTKLV